MTPATLTLTAEQKTFFHAHGYLVLPTLTTPDEVARLRVAYDRIFAERAGRAEGNQYDLAGTDEEGEKPSLPQILSPSKYAPELAESFALKNAEATEIFDPAMVPKGVDPLALAARLTRG